MTQNELNRAVARATGESVHTIAGLGFSIADPYEVLGDPEAKIVDWDRLEAERVGLFPG